MTKLPTTIDITGKEPWRNLTSAQHVLLREKMLASKTCEAGVMHGIISLATTPLEVALNAFVTQDNAMVEMKYRADVISPRPEPVLITGETGTGKELVAKILHGNRRGKFVAVNVTAVVDTLFESELFGHAKGSFTGAVGDRAGKVEQAENGTLFLDEIGDMPLVLQAKILRLVQENTYQRVGSNEDRPAKCRFVFATHCNMEKLVEEKKFREDLFYRIYSLNLHITPLAERLCDIQHLAVIYGVTLEEIKTFMLLILNNNLPGNCRQLQSLVLRFKLFGSIL